MPTIWTAISYHWRMRLITLYTEYQAHQPGLDHATTLVNGLRAKVQTSLHDGTGMLAEWPTLAILP